jgi:Cutinase
MIGVRGTNEPAGTGLSNGGRTYASGGLGGPIASLVVSASADPVLPFYVEALAYPAVALDYLNQQAPTYLASVNIGAANLRAEIENLASTCPYSNIILAGYSQGGDVIDLVLRGAGGSLSTSAKNHLSAVVMFGSPKFHGGEVWNAPGSGTGNGIFGAFPHPEYSSYTKLAWLPPDYSHQGQKTIIRSYCYPGDEFCQSNFSSNGAQIHSSYANNQSTMIDAWVFIKSWLVDNERHAGAR